MKYEILRGIKSPEDIKGLSGLELSRLCEEAREIIIDTVSKNGGHLASNLGAVELTVALHRAFNSPEDAIIFDVGHQCYMHKLLTGRFERFEALRKQGGLSGFMRPDESEHDPFITGHSSNSISAAYGIYKAKKIMGSSGTAVAVIGDGAMTGGMAFEALNNAASENGNFIIVINDNNMSISRNVGGMASAFTKLRSRRRYHKFKFAFSKLLHRIPLVGKPIFNMLENIKNWVKGLVYRNNVFTSMGYNYLGPVDGHNIAAMEALFGIAKQYNQPCVIHVITKKGKGYPFAENSPRDYHGVSSFDKTIGVVPSNKIDFSAVAGKTLCRLAEENTRICAITAAMKSGTGLSGFSERFPDRFFDVGIAEQHAVTFASGLASGGIVPFFPVYSSFLQRGYDQVIHDAAIAKLPLKILVDRAGIVGEDGETHQGLFDVAFLSTVPSMNIYSPSSFSELEYLIERTANSNELCAIRYPRGAEEKAPDYSYCDDFTLIGRSSKKLLVTYGRLFSKALNAENLDADILKLNRIYPISDKIVDIVKEYDLVCFFEEGIKSGGIAEKLGARLSETDYKGCYNIRAVEGFVAAANTEFALRAQGLDAESMENYFKTEAL